MKSDQARPLERLVQAAADQMTVSDKLGWLISEYATQGWQPPRNLYLGQVELQALEDTGGVVVLDKQRLWGGMVIHEVNEPSYMGCGW